MYKVLFLAIVFFTGAAKAAVEPAPGSELRAIQLDMVSGLAARITGLQEELREFAEFMECSSALEDRHAHLMGWRGSVEKWTIEAANQLDAYRSGQYVVLASAPEPNHLRVPVDMRFFDDIADLGPWVSDYQTMLLQYHRTMRDYCSILNSAEEIEARLPDSRHKLQHRAFVAETLFRLNGRHFFGEGDESTVEAETSEASPSGSERSVSFADEAAHAGTGATA